MIRLFIIISMYTFDQSWALYHTIHIEVYLLHIFARSCWPEGSCSSNFAVPLLLCMYVFIYTYSWQIQRQVLAYSHIQKVWFGLFRLNLRNERGGGHLSNKQQSKKYRVEEKNSRYRNTVVHGKKVLMYHHMYR